ncbi:MAG: hypothetical protein GY726_17860 [Proteobacteria bacterium]|nr:hypothetical protein [Pseudomonadota bacterium]
MAIKVLIRRKVAGNYAFRMRQLLSALDNWASKHTGYFYSENLVSSDNPGEVLCIATWQSIDAFQVWAKSTPSQQLEKQMASSLGVLSENAIYAQHS